MKNRNSMKPLYAPFFILITIAFLGSCKKDEVKPTVPVVNANYVNVNNWIDSNMRYWYFWADQIPANPDKTQKPDAFFGSLLYKTSDRFSWIQENYTDLLNELTGVSMEAGYDFKLYRASATNNDVVAVISYIKHNSPASLTSLKRGDVIYKINGTQLTVDNYQNVLNGISAPHTIYYTPNDPVNQKFLAGVTLSLSVAVIADDPNYLSKVFAVNNYKIGYYVYNFFANGDSSKFDKEMDNVFSQFQSSGITDLVLDLRYNSGGAVSSAINLASLIAPNVSKSDLFIKATYNNNIQNLILNDDSLGEEFLNDRFLEKTQNIGSLLSKQKIYVLTGPYTASASELIINGLRPYMQVYIIGDTTYGKNVASTSIYQTNNPNNKWGMQPIILRFENKIGFSDYTHGFIPNELNDDSDLYLYPLGDARETLLSIAINDITGGGILVRKSNEDQTQYASISSAFKARNTNMTVDPGKFKKLFR